MSDEWEVKPASRPIIDRVLMDSLAEGDKVAALFTDGDIDAIIQALKLALTISDIGNVPDKWRDMLKGLEILREGLKR